MKNKINRTVFFLTFIFLVLFTTSLAFAVQEIKVESEIDGIIVYPDSALLERVTNLSLEEGAYRIIFPDIISGRS